MIISGMLTSIATPSNIFLLFLQLICINFSSVISANEESEKLRFHHGNPLIYQIPSQVWSVNEKMHKEVYRIL